MGTPFFKTRRYLDTDKAKKLYDEGYSDQQIAEECDVSQDTVGSWRRRNGLAVHKAPRKARKKKHKTTLAELVAEARAHKMSYGQYMAMRNGGKND